MRILHTSDIHLDSALTARLPAARVRERKAELFASFKALSAEALKLGCQAMIIAGDLFDCERISRRAAERTLSVIESYPELDYLYLPGNHERYALLQMGLELPENLKIFSEDWSYFDYGEVRIGGASELREGICRGFDASGALNIGVLHGTLADRGTEDFIGADDLSASGIDYLALGHYHSYGVYKPCESKEAVYCGVPEGRGFDEAGTKGYVLIEADRGRIKHSFHPFARRTLHILRADVSTVERRSELARICDGVLGAIPSCDLVSLKLVGERAPSFNVDIDMLTAEYKERFYYFEVKDESRLRICKEDYELDKSLKGEFIRLALARDGLPEEDREEIIKLGLSALLGEIGEV